MSVVFTDIPRSGYDMLCLQFKIAGLPAHDLDEPGGVFFGLSGEGSPILPEKAWRAL